MKKNLSQKLLSYSALATAGILSIQKSDGQIVYTDVNDTTISSGTYDLDLNNDGIIDFFITKDHVGEFRAVTISPGNFVLDQVMGSTANSSVAIPYKLDFLDLISSAQHFEAGAGILSCTFSYSGNWAGGVQNHYLGLKFRVSSDPYFGWARLSVGKKSRHFTVKDYAYNSVPATAILAGDEGCGDNYEPNNIQQQAAPIQPNTLIRSQIATASDNDWYSFSISGNQNNARIILSSLLSNYNIKLFDQNGNFLSESANSGGKNDTIISNGLLPAIFYVKVFGKNGNFNSVDCYSMMLETSVNPFKEVMQQDSEDKMNTLNVFPNPVSASASVQFSLQKSSAVNIDLFDLNGRNVKIIAEGSFSAGNHELLLQKENLSSGIYFLQLRSSNGISTLKLVVQ